MTLDLFMDRSLAQRLERAEAGIGTTFVASRQQLTPESGAAWQDFDGTYAIFDGPESPHSQTFGLGLFGPPDSLADIEAFFETRGAEVAHEVSPLAGVETFALLAERGYRPIDLSSVLVQQIPEQRMSPSTALSVRVMEPADRATWVETAVAGWSTDPAYEHVIREMTEVSSWNRSMTNFLVELAGEPIATGALGIHEGVALLAGASTIPPARGRGAQALLLSARLAEARRRGCELAMMLTVPGTTSQRNAERRGFRVAYTRIKWSRSRSAA